MWLTVGSFNGFEALSVGKYLIILFCAFFIAVIIISLFVFREVLGAFWLFGRPHTNTETHTISGKDRRKDS
nr:MAG TPA: hypothetical protein [Caudoviricetes sp.]